ncbi:MAG: polymer-forming cytoskeletal protein [Flavobacteriales bacterium]|nr:polymer-forming cytoskeletal protein [Flavobacteriales bacterium]
MAKTNDHTQNLRVNSIVEGTRLKGEINSPGNFRIDGEVEGDMKIDGKLIIGAKGHVKGNVKCKDAEIEGRFDGKLSVNGLLSLKSTSSISGDAFFQRLMVAEGAKLTCTCNLKSDSPEIPERPEQKSSSARPAAPSAATGERKPGVSAIGA